MGPPPVCGQRPSSGAPGRIGQNHHQIKRPPLRSSRRPNKADAFFHPGPPPASRAHAPPAAVSQQHTVSQWFGKGLRRIPGHDQATARKMIQGPCQCRSRPRSTIYLRRASVSAAGINGMLWAALSSAPPSVFVFFWPQCQTPSWWRASAGRNPWRSVKRRPPAASAAKPN